MPSEDNKHSTLSGLLVQYRYALTILSMACFAFMLNFYSKDEMKLAMLFLVFALSLLTFKTHLIKGSANSVIQQIEQWLFEFSVILVISGFSSASYNPVFGAIALFFGVLLILIFLLLAFRKFFN